MLLALIVASGWVSAATVSGFLFDARTGAPVSLGAATLVRADGKELLLKSAKVDFDGSFVLSGVSPGLYQLVIRADGFAVETADVVITEPDEHWETDFGLRRTALVAGKVVDGDGSPVGGGRVFVRYLAPQERKPLLEFASRVAAVTNLQGEFRLPVRPDTPFELEIEAGAKRNKATEVIRLGEANSLSNLVLVAPAAGAGGEK